MCHSPPIFFARLAFNLTAKVQRHKAYTYTQEGRRKGRFLSKSLESLSCHRTRPAINNALSISHVESAIQLNAVEQLREPKMEVKLVYLDNQCITVLIRLQDR